MLAAYHGHSQLVRLLISHGANPNSLNDRGQSPLAGAVFKNESEVVKVITTPNPTSNLFLLVSEAWTPICFLSENDILGNYISIPLHSNRHY